MIELVAPPLSLYVHMPWCVRKCPYCDFNSHAKPAEMPEQQYIDALIDDLEVDLELVQGRPIESIFFGGGTPSLFSPEAIERLLNAVRAQVRCSAEMEVTLEANPGTIEHGRFAGYKAAGVNRISLGAQTFDEERLKSLGRIHGAGDIARAVDELRSADFDNFNLDLMYALPAQTIDAALEDVRSALALQPTHLSHYQLTLEPGTVFYHRPPALPDQDAAWEMQVECQALLATEGYGHYEVSAYAQAGHRCRHNLNYWEFGDYLGIGAGAHGKLTNVQSNTVLRTVRLRQPREYLHRSGQERLAERRVIPRTDLPLEFMINALRLTEGFVLAEFERRTGTDRTAIQPILLEAERRRLLTRANDDRWIPTELGQQFLNDLQALFLPA